ncbi:uncharacterized protein LOC134528092 [Bacillus rossius redtenbacheri]|uniref:uncharacterized protein LOC134528092 n=1 Tax=Bacillus rossius redtenbacheri TaxID=93214 RepID=UPI002FDEA6E0
MRGRSETMRVSTICITLLFTLGNVLAIPLQPCPREDSASFSMVLLPDSTNCTMYYICIFGDLVAQACPDGLHFDSSLQSCESPSTAGCELPASPSVPPTETVTESDTSAPTSPTEETTTEYTTLPTSPTEIVTESDTTLQPTQTEEITTNIPSSATEEITDSLTSLPPSPKETTIAESYTNQSPSPTELITESDISLSPSSTKAITIGSNASTLSSLREILNTESTTRQPSSTLKANVTENLTSPPSSATETFDDSYKKIQLESSSVTPKQESAGDITTHFVADGLLETSSKLSSGNISESEGSRNEYSSKTPTVALLSTKLATEISNISVTEIIPTESQSSIQTNASSILATVTQTVPISQSNTKLSNIAFIIPNLLSPSAHHAKDHIDMIETLLLSPHGPLLTNSDAIEDLISYIKEDYRGNINILKQRVKRLIAVFAKFLVIHARELTPGARQHIYSWMHHLAGNIRLEPAANSISPSENSKIPLEGPERNFRKNNEENFSLHGFTSRDKLKHELKSRPDISKDSISESSEEIDRIPVNRTSTTNPPTTTRVGRHSRRQYEILFESKNNHSSESEASQESDPESLEEVKVTRPKRTTTLTPPTTTVHLQTIRLFKIHSQSIKNLSSESELSNESEPVSSEEIELAQLKNTTTVVPLTTKEKRRQTRKHFKNSFQPQSYQSSKSEASKESDPASSEETEIIVLNRTTTVAPVVTSEVTREPRLPFKFLLTSITKQSHESELSEESDPSTSEEIYLPRLNKSTTVALFTTNGPRRQFTQQFKATFEPKYGPVYKLRQSQESDPASSEEIEFSHLNRTRTLDQITASHKLRDKFERKIGTLVKSKTKEIPDESEPSKEQDLESYEEIEINRINRTPNPNIPIYNKFEIQPKQPFQVHAMLKYQQSSETEISQEQEHSSSVEVKLNKKYPKKFVIKTKPNKEFSYEISETNEESNQ